MLHKVRFGLNTGKIQLHVYKLPLFYTYCQGCVQINNFFIQVASHENIIKKIEKHNYSKYLREIITKRLGFNGSNGVPAPFDSAVVIFGKKNKR
jgi:hypothetical protein